MAKIKTIFPPQVPSFLPAFDEKGENPKFYFKPSIANTIKQITGLHLIISRQDTNASVLSDLKYPFGMIFVSMGREDEDALYKIKYDKEKDYYYFKIDKDIFPQPNVAYKIQIRAVGQTTTSLPSDIRKVKKWLEDNLDNFSEWSVVTTMMPITAPDFGLVGLSEEEVNNINSSGYNFVGYYTPKKGGEQELLHSYRLNLFECKDYDNRGSWKLCSTSGEKVIGIYEKVNIEQVFTRDLEQDKKYIVSLTIKSKNLYVKTKYYKLLGAYPTIELFNSINLRPNRDEGKIKVDIQAKQILMELDGDSTIHYIKQDIGNVQGFDYHYAVINGSVSTNKNFAMNAEDDKWILQTRVAITHVHEDIEKAYNHPFITMTSKPPAPGEEKIFTRIKLLCYSLDLGGYPLMDEDGEVKEQVPDWEYRIVARKEKVLIDRNEKEHIFNTQDRVYRTKKEIAPSNEYYIYLKEDRGLMDLEVMEIKDKVRGIKTWLSYQE